ncbi:dienelactone hydrolase family protein [Alteraurantiacibacter aestuarii]|uniref:dienelactone hydrolase family protein n=1 Tax=Alteraurantiacibacter aestuarii TaxID=650004 RepID=UPI0031DBB5D3
MRTAHSRFASCLAVASLGLATALTAGCTTVQAPSAAQAGQAAPTVQSVSIAMADGTAGALLFTPAGTGPWPAVLLFGDASGLRPAFADIGRELAARGYVVLVPNEFYRSVALDGSAATAAPALPASETFQRGQQWRALATDDAVMADSRAYIAWLDSQASVDHAARAGAVGYDIGAAHAFLAARALPARIGVVAAAHPSAIATTRDNSPHLFVAQSQAAYLVQLAAPDDEREPEDKTDLRNAFSAAGLDATVSVVPAAHGFAVADQAGYDAAASHAFLEETAGLLDAILK